MGDDTEDLRVIDVLQDILGCDREDVTRIIEEKRYNTLRVADMKNFLGFYKDKGYKLHLHRNKAGLVIQMERFISNPVLFKRRAERHDCINASHIPPSLPTTPIMMPPPVYRHPYGSPVPIAPLPSTERPTFDNSEDEEEYLYQQLFHPPQPRLHPLLARPEAMSVIQDLRQYGFSMDQIIAGMELHPSCLHADTLMLAIIGLEEQKEMNADIDLAIIASEQERDAIQERKRRRVDVIEQDVSEHLLDIEEFQSSILLGRKRIASSCDSNSSDSGDCQHGSKTLKSLIRKIESPEYISHCNTALTRSNSVDSCDGNECELPDVIASTRKALVALLMAERDALKWYKEDAYNYFIQLQRRIDDTFPDLSLEEMPLSDITGLLTREKESLDIILYSMPEIPGAVPLGFRQLNTIGTTCKTKDFSLDDDGIEIIK